MSSLSIGLFVPLIAKADMTAEAEVMLKNAREGVRKEPLTSQWFAVKYGSAPHLYLVIDTFASNEGKAAHAAGEVAASLTKEAQEMTVLGVKPQGKSITILASKVAPEACTAHLTKGIRVLLEAKDGNDEDLRQFLIGGLPFVEAEPETLVWYAFEFTDTPGKFGIFDAFENQAGRDAHVGGKLAKALFAKAKEYCPVLEMCDIIAADVKIGA